MYDKSSKELSLPISIILFRIDFYFSSALRSPSTVRAGTREVHNKLEKNRRAHLKECFESLKRQLPVTADEKKTSNLSILGAAIRHIQVKTMSSFWNIGINYNVYFVLSLNTVS